MVSPTISELTAQAATLTNDIGQTQEYRKLWANMQYVCRQLQLIRAERHVQHPELDAQLETMKLWSDELIGKCDDWLYVNQQKLYDLMLRIVD